MAGSKNPIKGDNPRSLTYRIFPKRGNSQQKRGVFSSQGGLAKDHAFPKFFFDTLPKVAVKLGCSESLPVTHV